MEINELKRYARYNLWANERLIRGLNTMPEHNMDKMIISSFPSISKTIWHIWIAEYLWLERVQSIPSESVPENNYEGKSKELFKKTLSTSRELSLYTEKQDADTLFEELAASNSKGISFNHSRYQMIHHVINHSSYHRGQITTLCRQLGVTDFEPLDYIWFLRQGEG